MFNKILVPVDGSEASMKAVTTARKLVEEGSAREVGLVHVVQASDVMPVDTPQIHHDLTITAKQALENARAAMEPYQPAALHLEAGLPADIICRIARKENYDLIIIGNRGLNRLKRVLLGSISSKVVAAAHCPVLVVK
ncbi:MAG: universal stress protein [Syntrophomonadales bacterium]|jgi:nucleotide-binding universal stress UspA family protein